MTQLFLRRLVWLSVFASAMCTIAGEPTTSSHGEVTMSYFGETLTHPGARLDLKYPLLENELNGLLIGLSAGGYWHPKNEYAAHLAVAAGYRLTLPFGLVLGVETGVGYRHMVLDGVVYQMSSGVAIPIIHWGYPEFLTETYVELGWRFRGVNEAPLSLSVKLGMFGAFPVNYVTIWHPVVQVSFTVPMADPQGAL